jgi:hypothetical protein
MEIVNYTVHKKFDISLQMERYRNQRKSRSNVVNLALFFLENLDICGLGSLRAPTAD